jgi:hypothetical protein
MPLRRTRYFRDAYGNLTTSKREDEIVQVVLNWDPWLAAGESISSVAYDDSGVTRSATTNTGSVTTTSVTGSGSFEVTVTLSTGRKLQQVVRFISTDTGVTSDYR